MSLTLTYTNKGEQCIVYNNFNYRQQWVDGKLAEVLNFILILTKSIFAYGMLIFAFTGYSLIAVCTLKSIIDAR